MITTLCILFVLLVIAAGVKHLIKRLVFWLDSNPEPINTDDAYTYERMSSLTDEETVIF